ncbi:MAG: putative bifunctional diguanylate cyclase/phosphodiesterase [Magnetovibrionaceae bacterium]
MISEESLKEAIVNSNGIFHNAHDGIVAINRRSEIVYLNQTALLMFGYSDKADLIGQRVERLMNDSNAALHHSYVDRHLQGQAVAVVNNLRRIKAKHKSGALFPIDIHVFPLIADEERHYIAFIRDMSDLESKENELSRLAYYDPLTSLPNATSFKFFLNSIYSEEQTGQFIVAVMGIDHMRTINSTFGFDQGDEIIKLFANRLNIEFEQLPFVGRLFGDQFVIVVPIDEGESPEATLEKTFSRVETLIRSPLQVSDARVSTSVTVGAIHIPNLAETPELVVKHSEMAYGDAKQVARKQKFLLSRDRLDELEFSASLTHKLIDAIQNNEFFVVIQPKINVRTALPSGGEVLVRWKTKEGKNIGPDVFVPVAENAGLIEAIGRFVLLESCGVILSAKERGYPIPKLAVNASPHQLGEPEFIHLVEDALKTFSINPKHLEIEVTETAVAQHPDRVIDTLNNLRSLGCSIALDDFGTGHSSLTMLEALPINRVKLDKSFVDNLEEQDKAFSLVINSIKMMKDMDFLVTVEGIESRELHDMLYALGVDEAQGYFYSKPLLPEDFLEFDFEL